MRNISPVNPDPGELLIAIARGTQGLKAPKNPDDVPEMSGPARCMINRT